MSDKEQSRERDIHEEVFGKCWVTAAGDLVVSEKAIGILCDYIVDLKKSVAELKEQQK